MTLQGEEILHISRRGCRISNCKSHIPVVLHDSPCFSQSNRRSR